MSPPSLQGRSSFLGVKKPHFGVQNIEKVCILKGRWILFPLCLNFARSRNPAGLPCKLTKLKVKLTHTKIYPPLPQIMLD